MDAVMSVDHILHQITTSLRLFIIDSNSNVSFLIDSGSDVSVLPSTYTAQLDIQVTYDLFAANQTKIKTYGIKTLILRFADLEKDYFMEFYRRGCVNPNTGCRFSEFVSFATGPYL